MSRLKSMEMLRRCESGTSILETAIVLPLIVILMGGVYDFGRAFATMSGAQKSLRASVRYLSRLPVDAVCKSWARDQAVALAKYGTSDTSAATGTPRVSLTNISITTVPASCPANGFNINMSANVAYSSLMWSVLGLGSDLSMKVEHEEKWVGQ